MPNFDPIFTSHPQMSSAVVDKACTNLPHKESGIVHLFTCGPEGSVIHKVRFIPLGAVLASVVKVFVYKGADYLDPNNFSLVGQSELPSYDPTSFSAAPYVDVIFYVPFEANSEIWVGCSVAHTVGVCATLIAEAI